MFFGMLVAIVAVGGSVATHASSLKGGNGKLVPAWYSFTGSDSENPADYTRVDNEPSGCSTGPTVCSILAEPSSSNQAQPNLNMISETHYKAN